VLAAGERSARLTLISIHHNRSLPPEGIRSVGVYVPSPEGKSYLLLSGTIPVISTVIANYKAGCGTCIVQRDRRARLQPYALAMFASSKTTFPRWRTDHCVC
jgi:hypothetical protein